MDVSSEDISAIVDVEGSITICRGGKPFISDVHLVLGGRSRYWKTISQGGETSLPENGESPKLVEPELASLKTNEVEFTAGERVCVSLKVENLDKSTVIRIGVDADQIDIEEIHFIGKTDLTEGLILANGFHSWDTRKPQRIEDLAEGEFVETYGFSLVDSKVLFGFTGNNLAINKFRHYKNGRLEAISYFGSKVFDRIASEELTIVIYEGKNSAELLQRYLTHFVKGTKRSIAGGWCSWYYYYEKVREEDVVKNAEILANYFRWQGAEYVQLDDGYQIANGDWETNEKFPHGHRWLTNKIQSLGLKAGLWIAPFIIAEKSSVFKGHPDWMLKNEDKELVRYLDMPHWGGQTFILDPTNPSAQDWLKKLARKITEDWGYDHIKVDFMHIVSSYGTKFFANVTPVEAYLIGLKAIREGAGDAYLLGCGAPLLPSVGYVDGMRIGGDVWAVWDGIEPAFLSTSTRWFMNGKLFWTDPDCLLVREPLTIDEARTWASFYTITGQMNLLSDDLGKLGDERLGLLQKTFPIRVPYKVEPVITPPEKPRHAPAITDDKGNVFELNALWKFIYDDGNFAGIEVDDSSWDKVEMPHRWKSDYDGFGWYRLRFKLPRDFLGGNLTLELGRVDDSDETFLNVVSIGKSGEFPPNYESAWPRFRRYKIPKELLRDDEENVLAVRAYDGGGAGGIYNLEPNIPGFEVWRRFERVDGGDGAVLFMNLQEHERTFTLELEKQYLAFDYWQELYLGKLNRLTIRLKPHECGLIWLREPTEAVTVLGTSSHITGRLEWESEGNSIMGSIPKGNYLESPRIFIYVPENYRIAQAEGEVKRVGEPTTLTLSEGISDFRVVFAKK